MRRIFVYYRVDPALAGPAAVCVDAMLAALEAHCSEPPRRLQRCDDTDTWMEAYTPAAGVEAFMHALEAAVIEAGCARFTLGERHLECFIAPAVTC